MLKLSCSACLFGCSSGRLDAHGAFQPTGFARSFIQAGCPTVVGNLWDVTDKDIDLFAAALLNQLSDGSEGKSLAAATRQARAACKMKFLNGAAPVCYGLPLSLKLIGGSKGPSS